MDDDDGFWQALEKIEEWFCGCPDEAEAKRRLRAIGCDARTRSEIIAQWKGQT